MVGSAAHFWRQALWSAGAVACPGVAEVSGVKGRAVGPSREARCEAPLRPEGRPRSLRSAGKKRISGGEAASDVVCVAGCVDPRSCRHLRLEVGLGAGALVVDWAEHAVGGMSPEGVVLVDPVRHRAAGLLPGGEVVLAKQLEFQC